MLVKVNGIILKISQTVHSSRLLFLLTEERGRILVFDNRNKSGGKKALLDLFTYGEFILYKNGDKYTLNSVTTKENFYKLRENIQASALASYFAQLSLFITQDSSLFPEELLPLMLNSLYLLTHKPEQIIKVKAVFEWKAIRLLGFAPSLQACSHVSYDKKVLLSLEDGGLYCQSCVPVVHNAAAFTVEASEVKAISFILQQPPSKAFSFKISDISMQKISRISEEYLRYHCTQDFSALEMYNMLG